MRRLLIPAFFIVLCWITGCENRQSDQTDLTAESSAPRPIPTAEVLIEPGLYDAPDSLTAGYVTIKMVNNTREMHSAHLIRLDDGYSSEQLIAAYADSSRTRGTRPDWMTHRGGPLGEPGTSSVTLDLQPGNYVWVCVMGPDTIPHFTGNEHQAVVVKEAETETVPLSEPDTEIHMTDENHELTQPLAAGKQSVEIKNTGSKYHLAAISKLNEGFSTEDYLNWFTAPNGPPPAKGVAATSAIGPGLSARLDLDLEPGEYVLFSFANADGIPHMFQGAVQSITVE